MIDITGRRKRSQLADQRSLTAGDRDGFASACLLIPRIETLVREFNLAPWMRMEEMGFRSYRLAPRMITPIRDRELRIVITDAHASQGCNDPDLMDLQTVTISHTVGKQITRLVVREMPSMLWTQMPARTVSRNAGNLAATALGVLRSHVMRAGIVSEENARSASLYASARYYVQKGTDEPADDFIDVWSVTTTSDTLCVRPIVESLQSSVVSPMDMLRYSGAYLQVDAAQKALRRA